jgi:Fe-Mn family superoxide dismutase
LKGFTMLNPMPLPFDQGAIAPLMSAETFEYHYGKHFMAYVNKVNELVPDAKGPLETLIGEAHSSGKTALFNAAGQTWNHAFFWMSIAPREGTAPDGALAQAIDRDFGSFGAFATAFTTAGGGQFGSGWVWLVSGADGKLALATTHDADPVWINGDATPLLVCDVWEHAYYIDWRNNRGGFLKDFIEKRANWDFAATQFDAVTKGDAGWQYPN